MDRRVPASLLLAAALLCPDAGPAAQSPDFRPVTWDEARPMVERVGERLPPSLRAIPPEFRPVRWQEWVHSRRQETEERLTRGEADSLVNLLLFGTSFTKEPRITAGWLADLDRRWRLGDTSAQQILAQAYQRRAADLAAAAAAPGTRARLQFAQRVLARRGHDLASPAGRDAAARDLLGEVMRVREEASRLAEALETARGSTDAEAARAARVHLFRDRGLAPDSSVLTQFAVDEALCAMRSGGADGAPVTRVAVVGPGLDFTDKQEGVDFYEPQSLQPFTVADSLLRCGLASPGRLEVVAIDVSERVDLHLRAAAARAASGREPYRLVFSRDSSARWSDAAVGYWKKAGERIGEPLTIEIPPALPGILARGVAVRPDVVTRLVTVRADIVLDRPVEGFNRADLVIATNVLLYYDDFEQALALASIGALLRPGGRLLTNDAVDTAAAGVLVPAGELTVRFSAAPGDGERMYWLKKEK